MTAVFRFAPSPNGRLHLGHALSALLNQRMAEAAGGTVLLRIEDIDTVRCTPELVAGMLDDLDWLGFRARPPHRRQSEHFADYAAALDRLQALGLVYDAYLTRGEIREVVRRKEAQGGAWPRDPDGAPVYPGDRTLLSPDEIAARRRRGEPHALRLDMAKALAMVGEGLGGQVGGPAGRPLTWQETGTGPAGETGEITAHPEAWGDVILARKDTPTSYHLSVVLDDALQGVTHVVRGQDLFQATAVHRLLQTLLDLPAPVYHHHRLITDATGRKLSKSAGDTALHELRAAGWTPTDVRARCGL
ncbi:tRNA glutamyl-Q(34) synthetase GluQRS [Pannonibacter tanglangensis]|uniref:tRNA glutamyl-Q(34) synthetase GluQRS n=1 Tax=Pannonibacter tanglangensis TaxID=2750084 RepID=A0ABW9ZPH3_9HYPH|nr:tRNA glutamyl-Q(34) synthetase GluQRS [Pannonibacter sp. XCT-34]NBN65481.1 tRNA glutamyl-Q(34) synthetase GluQRS [Pannonibacter sp. XCT-34]